MFAILGMVATSVIWIVVMQMNKDTLILGTIDHLTKKNWIMYIIFAIGAYFAYNHYIGLKAEF